MHTIYRKDLPADCVADCSHQGACDEDVAIWLKNARIKRLLGAISIDTIRHCLKGYGAWDEEELSDDEQNRARILWLACGSFREGEDMFFVE